MSILSTNQRLIKVGQDYSAGSGIDITNHVISVTGEVGGNTYSAGDNIDIYEQNNQLYISGKDWTNDIENASANAYEQAIAQIPAPQDLSYISAKVDTNTSGIDYLSGVVITALPSDMATTGDISDLAQSISETYQVKGDYLVRSDSANFYPMSGNPSGFLTAHQSLDGYATTSWVNEQGYITGVDLSNYYQKNETSSKQEISAAIASIPMGDEEVNELVRSNSGEWNNVSSKLDESTFQETSGLFLTAIPQEYITESELPNLISAKLDISSFSSVSSNFLVASSLNGYATESFVENVSGDITALIPTDYYPNTNPSGFISGIDLSNYYQKNETSSKQEISAAIANIPQGDPDVNNVVHTNSSTWNDITAYQTNSSNYLTAHQDISNLMPKSESANFYPMTGNPSGFINNVEFEELNLSSFATSSQISDLSGAIDYVSGTISAKHTLSAGSGISFFEDGVNNITRIDCTVTGGAFPISADEAIQYVQTNSSTINDVNTSYQTNSGTFLTAHQDLSDYATTAELALKQDTLTFDYDEQDRISAINNSAIAAGDEFPVSADEAVQYVQTNSANIDETVTEFQTNSSTYMVEPNLEYNSQGYINGYNGSAVATIDQERQWFTHDDTLTHISNSAQYALGVNLPNISADLARMLGVDETVLWSGNLANTGNIVLSEASTGFNKVRLFVTDMDNRGGTNLIDFVPETIINIGYTAPYPDTTASFMLRYSTLSSTDYITYNCYKNGRAVLGANAGFITGSGPVITKVIGIGRKN